MRSAELRHSNLVGARDHWLLSRCLRAQKRELSIRRSIGQLNATARSHYNERYVNAKPEQSVPAGVQVCVRKVLNERADSAVVDTTNPFTPDLTHVVGMRARER